MPTFEVKVPVGANQIWMRGQIREAVAEATRRGKLRPEFGRFDHGEELRRQPGPWHADHSLRSVGSRRDRDQAHFEGRRLRKHQRAVRVAGGTAASGTCGSHARRRAEVHPARCLERPGQGLQPWGGRRVHRRRSDVRLCPRERATVPHAGRRQSRFPAGGARGVHHGEPPTRWESAPWASAATVTLIGCKVGALNRLPASFFVSVAYDCWAFRRLGVVLDASTGAIKSWLYRDPSTPDHPDARSGRLHADGPRSGAPRAAHRRRRAGSEGRRRRAPLRAACSRDATPCIRI